MTTTLSEFGVHREILSPRASSHRGSFIDDLAAYATQHQAQHWRGTFAEFLEEILPKDPSKLTRSSHQYIYDMLCAYRDAPRAERRTEEPEPTTTALFSGELFGIDSALERVIDYFKAAAAGSDVGRRLLLLLGPPSGGKSSLVILLKRGLEEYSHTDDGALYALQGSPLHESPLNLIPVSMRPKFRATYGVDIQGELSPYARARLDDEFQGDFMRFPVERIFLSEAARIGVGTYAPHDPTTADIADLVGSVDLSKVADIGDEGDPRAWSWSGAVYAASRGVLEMIEILKVKREFLYLLLTLTQE
jgi:serine protein kinase